LSTGGVVTALCPQGGVYAMCCESIHNPKRVINDMPRMTLKHGNHRQADMFCPIEGQIVHTSDENLQQLKAGTYLFAESNNNSTSVREHECTEAVVLATLTEQRMSFTGKTSKPT